MLLILFLLASSTLTNGCMDVDDIRFSHRPISEQLGKAMQRVKQVLDSTRNPQFFDITPHSYNDKYILAQTMTQTAMAAYLNVFSDMLGLSQDHLSQVMKWAADNKTITMLLNSKSSVTFSHKAEREVESPTVVEERTGFLFSGITTHKVVTKVTDFHWKAGTEWELKLYAGSIANQQQLQLMGRSKIIDVITPTDVAPGAAPQVNFRSHESKNV